MKRRYIRPAMGFVAARTQRLLMVSSIKIASDEDAVDASDAAGRSDDEDNEW